MSLLGPAIMIVSSILSLIIFKEIIIDGKEVFIEGPT